LRDKLEFLRNMEKKIARRVIEDVLGRLLLRHHGPNGGRQD
jgi:hypothetical protein